MRIADIIIGMQILSRHYTNGLDAREVGAEHDILQMWKTDTPLTTDEVMELRGLGWFQPEVDEGECYDPDESWGCYV